MVKLFFFLKRHPEMSAADFHRHWTHRHGPLFAGCAAVRRYVVRYEQNHTAGEASDLPCLSFDGVSVMWFRSIDDFQALRADSEYRDIVVRDGETFCDASATRMMVVGDEERFEIIADADERPNQ
jgi:uncharacterized protein (TIGR02118 family)